MSEIEDFDIISNRRNIALTKASIDRLKAFSKERKLKMYEVIGVIAKMLVEDSDFADLVAHKTKKLQDEKKSLKAKPLLSNIKPELRQKLASMSEEEIEALLSKAS